MRENNAYANKTWKYYYDNAGNITMRDEYAYTTGTLPAACQSFVFYDYSTGTWGDLLTNYDGTTINYDNIGNPTNWRNGASLTWNGRNLTSHSSSGGTLTYEYNSSGIRTRKHYVMPSGVPFTHDYVLDDTNIVKETVDGYVSYTMYFYYDETGVCGLEFNGETYYYLKNIQGDVVKILNASGQVVVEYTYDAWGKVLSTTGSLSGTVGFRNPFRYRGYYYDTETGFYYLQTRYYDPEVGRFINADGIVGANGGVLGYNMFAYCNNNPVMGYDPSGEGWFSDIFKKIGNWIDDHKEQILSTVATVAVAVVTVAAVVATAGAAGAVVGGMAAAYGASTAAAAAIGTAVELGGYAVAYGVGAFATSDVYETWTGTNPIRDNVFNGNETAYGAAEAVLMTAAGGYVDLGLSGMPPASQCFIAGTLVLTAAGLKAIEDIQEGDIVEAENPETGEKGQKRVVQTFVNETQELVHLFVENEEIVTTPTHPFWVINAEWCSAIEIRAGDILKLADGRAVTVTATEYEKLDTPVKVYNFEVEDFHTYYVGEQAVLVHNKCAVSDTPASSPESFTRLKNDQGFREKRTGLIWKKDMFHKDHYDVTDAKGVKVKEIRYDGTQLWPNGPKNKNK